MPWMPLVDIAETEPTGNSLDPSSDRREQSGRGFTNGVGRTGNKTSSSTAAPAAVTRPVDSPATVATAAAGSETEDDQFPYDEVHDAQQTAGKSGNGSAGEEIREPVLRPKSRFRMYRMPDGSAGVGNGTSPSTVQQTNGSAEAPAAATTERSFIVHLLPQKLMNMIEQAERYARMAFSPFMWPSKERTQRALKHFPRSVHARLLQT